MTERTLAVLRFRRIDTPASRNWLTSRAISEEAFSNHLHDFRKLGWEVIGAGELLLGLADATTLPERAVLLTIDGPYRSLLRFALPVLRSYRFPAVLFVPSGFVGRRAALETEGEEDEVCTCNDLKYIAGQDVSIQSQGVTNRGFFGLDAAEQEQEAAASRAALEATLGSPVELFAFPRGDAGPNPSTGSEIVRRAGYRAAFILGGGVNRLPGADPYRLARITIGPDTDLGRELGSLALAPE